MSKTGKGKRVKREVDSSWESNRGWWDANTKEKDIKDSQNHIIGHVRLLNFCAYKNNKKMRTEAQDTEWLMHEYRLSGDDDVSIIIIIIFII